ncbi:uncharacterized protein EV420DRAFT_716899 [Desarmillaria tabescens]|uniref:Oxidoreductase AflY n=1 Tax=Armillaria tabescens TaxID=1929756 RepID=A0AA39JYZ7_ARMTA|nr:uncharacterized protein EV420DRAFT_716899 [Desarmillaria tabescens]KAK0451424.1 hypothetical protein EV420DRAFT_716899 [Desarmillaria tabescens]
MSSSTLELFPAPSSLPSSLAPAFLPGADAESTLALQSVLRDDYEKWHTFFNDKGFHNHIVHHVLAVWALGASKEIIEAVYREDSPSQRPAIKSPGPISSANFNAHLGDEKYYGAYMTFFKDKIAEKGIASVLEEFVFSEFVNVDATTKGNQQPAMLNRLMASLIHPMIHMGNGLEFGLPGIVIEGLAQTAVHPDNVQNLLPYSALTSVTALDAQAEKATSLETPDLPSGKKGTHAFDILARVLKDETLTIPPSGDESPIRSTIIANGEALFRYTNQWSLHLSDPQELHRKIEELQWMNTIIYAISGFRPGKRFHANFFLMHLVTSAIFLPSFVTFLSTTSQALLLRSYMTVTFAWWISCGRPSFDIPKFFEAQAVAPNGSSATVADENLSSTPNPWFAIIQQALFHPDDHLCKIQRALAYYATLYGTRPSGQVDFTETELPGAEKLDGTLFLRAAQLTAKHFELRRGEKFTTETPLWDYQL